MKVFSKNNNSMVANSISFAASVLTVLTLLTYLHKLTVFLIFLYKTGFVFFIRVFCRYISCIDHTVYLVLQYVLE